jgi:Holliday junction resolvasome RuvABC endonuclease subunit
MVKKILSLDISSTTIGWALLEEGIDYIKIIDHNHIKPVKDSLSLANRALKTQLVLKNLIKKFLPDYIAIEDYVSRFTFGRSTAKTIIVLSVFNEAMTMSCIEENKVDPDKIAVISIRSILSKTFGEKISSKEECFDFIKKIPSFKIKLNKKQLIKKETFDEADAVAVGIASIVRRNDGKKFNLQ